MSVARRLVRLRLAALVVCAGGALLAAPSVGLAADWTGTVEPVPASTGASQVATGLDNSQNLTELWSNGSGIEVNVRSADGAWGSAQALSTSPSASDPDVAVATDGTAVATWSDSGEVWASVRSNGSWTTTDLSPGSSPQATIVNDTSTVFWTDGVSIASASAGSAGMFDLPTVEASSANGAISDLRVAVSASGDGAATWLAQDSANTNVDSAVITAGAWAAGSTLSSTADPTTSSVAVGSTNEVSAIAWTDGSGLHTAILGGGDFTPDPGGDQASATDPSVAVDTTGRVFVSSIDSGAVETRIRSVPGTWSGPSTQSTDGLPTAPDAASDPGGDVIVSWATTSGLALEAYDATPPTVAISAPPSPTATGNHTWSATVSDVWSSVPGTVSWTFSDGPDSPIGTTVTHDSETPGTVTANATATDAAGNTSAAASAGITIDPVAAVNTAAPSITGDPTPADGTTLTAVAGTWTGKPTPSVTHTWQRCSAGLACAAIPGAGDPYTLTSSDVGYRIRLLETATNSAGSPTRASVETAVVGPLAVSGVAPTLTASGGLVDGGTLTAGFPGTLFDGASNLAITYAFSRCTSSCAVSQTASASNTYALGPLDVGATILVSVKATVSVDTSSASASAQSSQTALIAPTATAAPTISGSTKDGSTLTAVSPASMWDNVSGLTVTYQFSRCDSSGTGCGVIGPPTPTATYTLGYSDIGATFKVFAYASRNSSAASQSGASAATTVVSPLLLTAPGAPTGTLKDGAVLSATSGSWVDQGHGFSYLYEWFHCTPGCSSLGAPSSSSTYTLRPSDVGDTIKVVVTAFVGAGAASSTSAATTAIAPTNTGASTISVPTQQRDGQVFSASDGSWNGAAGLTVSYQWRRCTADGTACSNISSATSKSYSAGPADVASTLEVLVAASANGSSTTTANADSAATAVIAPRNTAAPQVSGDPTDGKTLTTAASAASSWNNTPALLSYAYQWMRCDTAGANCSAISGATALTYVLTPVDVSDTPDATHRHTIRMRVTASTANGASTFFDSAATGLIAPQPTVLTTLPSVVGNPIAGQVLSVSSGAWTGTGVATLSYQWIHCDPSTFKNCVDLGAASPTSQTYTVQKSDIGKVVTFVQTVVNRIGAQTAQQAPFTVTALSNVLGATQSPFVSAPDYVDGTTLSTDNGSWLPADSLAFTYHWLRCPTNVAASSCPVIAGATLSIYQLTPADVGSYVVSQVRADYLQNGVSQTWAVEPSEIDEIPIVTALPPTNRVKPSVSGGTQQGATLTATPGTWGGTNTGAAPITYSYQWLRCSSGGTGCVAIAGATKTTYSPSASDVGSTLVVRVTAVNPGGSSAAASVATAVVTGLPAASTGGGGEVSATPPAAGPAIPAIPGGGGHDAGMDTADHSAPRLTLAFVAGGKLALGRVLSLNATCPASEKTCKSRFQLLAVLKKHSGKAVAKPVSVASTTVTLKGGQKRLLKLTLSAPARAALKRLHTLKVTLAVAVTDAAGNVTPKQTKALTLRWR